VNRDDLRAALAREGVRQSAYNLDGENKAETYCFGIVPGGWAVWYSERGRHNDEVVFDTEDEACSELLLRVVNDPTTRLY
jgi:hypothetical protein